MPLTYNFTEIRDYEDLHKDEFERYVTDAIVWLSMPLGVGTITEDNADLFHFGITVLEGIHGMFLNKGGKPYRISQEDVRRRTGLRTNAGGSSVNELKKSIRRVVNENMGRVV